MSPRWAAFCAFLTLIAITRSTAIFAIILLLPSVLTIIFYMLKNQQCSSEQKKKFFAGFEMGGHRGSNWKQPENSIAAFVQSKYDGCQLVEFDIEKTKDDVLIIMHDDSTGRTATGNLMVKDTKFEDIKKLKLTFQAKGSHTPQPTKETVPTLAETISWCKENHVKMLFDVKHFHAQVIRTIVALFEQHDIYDHAIVSAFNPLVPFFVKRKNPKILTGYTTRRFYYSSSSEDEFVPRLPCHWNPLLEMVDEVNNQFVSHFVLPAFLGVEMLLVNHRDISQNLVAECARNDVNCVAWTVNDPVVAKWMKRNLNIPFLTDTPETVRTAFMPSTRSTSSALSTSKSTASSKTSLRTAVKG